MWLHVRQTAILATAVQAVIGMTLRSASGRFRISSWIGAKSRLAARLETRDGPLRFRLANHRLSAQVMNKLHVNIPQASQPQSVAVVCHGKIVDKRPIAAVAEKLTFTVNGSSSRDRSESDRSP